MTWVSGVSAATLAMWLLVFTSRLRHSFGSDSTWDGWMGGWVGGLLGREGVYVCVRTRARARVCVSGA